MRYARAVRMQWTALKPLLRRGMRELRSAEGFKAKLASVRRLTPKAWRWLAHHSAIAAARTSTLGSTRLADYIPPPTAVPECLALGGGIFAIALPAGSGPARVSVRDRFNVSHDCRQIGEIRHDGRQAAHDELAGDGAVQFVLQAPAETFSPVATKVDVTVARGDETLVFEKITLGNASAATISSMSVENSLLNFSGSVLHALERDLHVGVLIDAVLATSLLLPRQAGKFVGSVILDANYLDGASHDLELRELPAMSLLASTRAFLPLHITPWSALQAYSGEPFDGTLAPAARHHFKSLQLWMKKLEEGAHDVPPISLLHAELLRGFQKRSEYPTLHFPQHTQPVASVVIPAHNKFEITYNCLCSLLFAYNDTPFEVIVVDDGSSDQTRDIEHYVTGVRVLRHEEARGFVDSCNDGAARARGEFVALLNNDVEATARWLDELVATFRDFDNVGLAGAKLVYPDGRLQEAGGIVWKNANPWNVGRGGNAHDPKYNYVRRVDYVSGAAIMLPRAVWDKVGGFDPAFSPGYFEDTDLAMKVKDAGHLVVYVPTSTIIHYEGQSAGTDTTGGMKRFQEVNRPKFRQKWSQAVQDHGNEPERPDREKDRGAVFRVLFLDHQVPHVDGDAGSYAAFQEMRLLHGLGAKVTMLPRNLAFMDRHTLALERVGVECLYAPFVTDFVDYLRTHGSDYDAVFVCRYQIAEQVLATLRASAPKTKIIFNLADLHFLREIREAAAGTEGYTRDRADETRAAELRVVEESDLTFSYTDVELAVLESHLRRPAKLAQLPWVADSIPLERRFAQTEGALFIGSINHPPNRQAAKFFAEEIMPALRERLAGMVFDVVGRGTGDVLANLARDDVRIHGYVPSLDGVLARTRVFVAPLAAGAGLKGKIIEAISRGVPCVVSPVAAEGTGLVHGLNCLVAESPKEWTECVAHLYTDEALWSELGTNALQLARAKYAFEGALDSFERALEKIGLHGRREGALVYRHARPLRYGF